MFDDKKTKFLLTHEEAIQKSCPMQPGPCKGVHCMAWRWPEGRMRNIVIQAAHRDARTAAEAGPHPHRIPKTDLGLLADQVKTAEFSFEPPRTEGGYESPACWRETDQSVAFTTPGYCGMVTG